MKTLACFFLLAAIAARPLCANNLQISSVTLTGQNTTSHYTRIQFTVTWDNSWRDGINWDAAWLFVKYSTDNGQTWKHATLNTSAGNHTAPGGSTLTPTSDGKGVLLYRSSTGSGSATWTGVELRWEYGTDNVNDDEDVKVKVFGIEMVYVQQKSFYAGDGTASNIYGHFEDATSGNPMLITGEGQLTLGGGGSGSLGNNNATNAPGFVDDFNDATSQTLPAAFPKGYNAFYCMKYEMTQEQYRDFLNCLTRAQQINRVWTDVSGTNVVNRYVMTNQAFIVSRNGIRCDATLPATGPITLYCDGNTNGTYNESSDGQNIACGNVTANDFLAYADWAALRPMTELEYEKACRGHKSPLADEFAWGTTSMTGIGSLNNGGSPNESSATTGANWSGAGAVYPVRVGIFATTTSSRETSGASYYGAMEMSGNVCELAVAVGHSQGRGFTGVHGDGELTAAGNANAANWPNNNGIAIRGATTNPRVSDRYLAASGSATTGHSSMFGTRCVRTAP